MKPAIGTRLISRLDEIRETRGQRGRQNDAVEIARVIRDDDAGVVRLDRAALDAHRAADERRRTASPRRGRCAGGARRPGVTASTTHSGNDDDEQREPRIAAVGPICSSRFTGRGA